MDNVNSSALKGSPKTAKAAPAGLRKKETVPGEQVCAGSSHLVFIGLDFEDNRIDYYYNAAHKLIKTVLYKNGRDEGSEVISVITLFYYGPSGAINMILVNDLSRPTLTNIYRYTYTEGKLKSYVWSTFDEADPSDPLVRVNERYAYKYLGDRLRRISIRSGKGGVIASRTFESTLENIFSEEVHRMLGDEDARRVQAGVLEPFQFFHKGISLAEEAFPEAELGSFGLS